MYFWNVERLKAEMRRGPLPPGEILRYSTAFCLLWSLTSLIPVQYDAFGIDDGIFLLLIALITVLGLWWAYRANGGAEGSDLAGRYLAFGWVIGLRLMALLAMVLALVAAALVMMESKGLEVSDTILEIAGWSTAVLTQVFFYWRMAHHFSSLRQTT